MLKEIKLRCIVDVVKTEPVKIIPYTDLSSEQKRVVEVLSGRMASMNYTPRSAWEKNGTIEVYSEELDEKGQRLCKATYNESEKKGYIFSPKVTQEIVIEKEGKAYVVKNSRTMGITPYGEANAEQKAVLKAMGKEMRAHGYTPSRGWVRDGNEYEVYSVELHSNASGESACKCVLKANGRGTLESENKKETIKIEDNGRGQLVVKEVADKRKKDNDRER